MPTVDLPTSSDYIRAVKRPDLWLKSTGDRDLIGGSVEMVTFPTAQGPLEQPWKREGGFAVVFKFRRKSGRLCALRCYTSGLRDETHRHYLEIGPFLQAHLAEHTAGFTYYEKGIRLPGGSPTLYPVID